MTVLRRLEGWLSNPLYLAATVASLVPIVLILFYVQTYRLSVPYDDEWDLNGDVAVATADGSLTLQRLIPVNGGHRTLFTNLATAILTAVGRWNLETQGWLTALIVLVTYGLLLLLFRRTERSALFLVLVPFSLLLFAVYRRYNWWSVRQSHWSLVNTFVIAIVLVVSRERLTGRAFALALVLGWCATFTSAAGMVVWPLIVVVLWLLGQRDWRYYLLWIVSGAISIGLYLHDSGMISGIASNSVPTGDPVLQAKLPLVRDMLEFLLKYLGNGIFSTVTYADTAMRVGLLALVLYLAQLLILWRLRHAWKPIVIWTALAVFSLLSGLLIGLGRVTIAGADRAFTVQYIAAAGLFWLALVALTVISAQRLRQSNRRAARWIVALDVIIAFVFLSFYLYSSAAALGDDAQEWKRSLVMAPESRLRPEEQCVLNYPFSRVSSCLGGITNHVPKDLIYLDEISERRLTIFASIQPQSLLPSTFTPDSKILLASTDAWLNIHTRDQLLAGSDDSQITHLVSNASTLESTSGAARPLTHVLSDALPASVQAFMDWATHSPQVWVLQIPEVGAQTEPFMTALRQQGYYEIYRRTFDSPDVPREFILTGYVHLSETPRPLYRFGTQVALQQWSVAGSVDVQRCESVTLQSIWSVESAVSRSYRLAIVLAGSDGVGVARTDGVPSATRMPLWQPNQLNLDRHAVSVPCDLPSGDYSLLVGMDDLDSHQALPITTAEGGSVGNLLYLTTLHVQ